ncbi:MAG TPA: PKD domain-containing protein [Phycisphaerae bacterium]|nr:PKD domain-containing protein [Phycisphaerae bacterium]
MVRYIRFGASGLVTGLCVAVAAAGQPARPFVHSLFQDHMVLQRGKPACVWGWTKPGATVRVELAGRGASAEAEADGRWLARLGPFEAGGPHELKITGPQSVTVKDVLIGEVWVCSGQSNMQFNLGTIKDGGKAIREADDPTIRFLCLFAPNGEFGSKQPLEDLSVTKGDWQVCTPRTAERCSATAYFFGRAIQRHLKVPVGLIVSALNGSPIEAWISKKALMSLPVYSKGGRFSPDWDPNDTPVPYWYVPCARYNAQIRPLAPFAIRGFLFYQGETNAMWGRGLRYRELLPLLIRDWRECWGDESLPFIPIQLANTFGAQDPNRPFAGRCKWAEVQEAQLRARRVPHTETAVILDLCDGDLHPPNKPGIGQRAARVARKVAYGEDLVVMGPTFREMKVEGGKARLYFDDLGGGLLSRDGRPLRFFNVAGEDKRFVVAEAAIDGDTVVVSSPQVARPAAVRYAWATNPLGVNFLNRAGLPAPPFRTDDWNDESRPTAAFSHKASGADAPVAVVFDGSKSRDPEQNIVSLAWDFGDGATATGPGPVHVFGKGGTYNVRLTVLHRGTPQGRGRLGLPCRRLGRPRPGPGRHRWPVPLSAQAGGLTVRYFGDRYLFSVQKGICPRISCVHCCGALHGRGRAGIMNGSSCFAIRRRQAGACSAGSSRACCGRCAP